MERCRALGAEEDGVVSYGAFRNFVMLLPAARLQALDPSLLWFNAASSVPFGAPLAGCNQGGSPRKPPCDRCAVSHVLRLAGSRTHAACCNR